MLQPTHTAAQKARGTTAHATLNGLALAAFTAAFAIIVTNKARHAGAHFASAHARLGLAAYVLVVLQAGVGVSIYYLPRLYGSRARAQAVWKYHRASGYVVLLLGLATVLAATWTDFNVAVLKIRAWVVGVGAVLVVAGVGARVRKQKLGFGGGSVRATV